MKNSPLNSNSPTPPDPEVLPDIEKLLAEWQYRLRLQDWDITVEWVSHFHVEAFGRTKTSLANRTAMVDLVPPDQIDHSGILSDPEVTLVHELLHVKAAEVLENRMGTDRPDLDSPLWECFIDQLAQALVAAKRGRERIR